MSDSFPIEFGRYQLVERLAVGGMAELYKARVLGAHGFAKPVVIKKILPHLAADEAFVAMFIDEAHLTARLDHPKIAQVLELGKIEDQLYICMEFVDGIDALALLRGSAQRKTSLPEHLAVHIAHEVLDALDYAHRVRDDDGSLLGIVHRDISPSNVLISRRGDVKLADFGIAHAIERQQKTQSGTLKGKYGYMSPEQVVGGHLDGRSDLFSVGIVLCEMLMGRRLFTAPNDLDVLLMVRDVRLTRLEKFGGDIDAELRPILLKALQRDPKDRYPTAGSFRDALAEWLFAHRRRVGPADLARYMHEMFGDELPKPVSVRPPAAASPPPAAATPPPPPPSGRAPSVGTPGPSLLTSTPASAPRGVVEPPAAVGAGSSGRAAPPRLDPAGPPAAEPRVASRPPLAASPSPGAAAGRPAASSETAPHRPPHGEGRRLPGRAPERPEVTGGPGGPGAPGGPGGPGGLTMTPSGSLEIPLDLGGASDPGLEVGPPVHADLASTASEDAFGHVDRYAVDCVVIEEPLGEPAAGGRPPGPGPWPVELDFSDVSIDLGLEEALASKPNLQLPTELAAVGAPPPPRATSIGVVAGPPDEEGDLVRTSPIHILYKRAIEKANGLVVFEISAISKEIYISGGVPEYVSSNVARELLGEYLVAQKVISSGELAMALAMMPHFGGKLGDALVGLGLMKPLDVFRHLTRQVRDKLIDVCTWQKGHYRWYRGRKNPREAFPLGLDSFEVLGAGATAIGAETVEAWVRPRLTARPVAAKNPRVVPEAFRLGPYPREVYNRLDGRHAVKDFLARYTAADDRTVFLRTLYLLVQTELVTLA